jgi:hypothetical protein
MSQINQWEKELKQILSGVGYAGKHDQLESMKYFMVKYRQAAVKGFMRNVMK